jgi:HPt (histidine-containing phosphotransfer) domain-containing protein
MAGNIGAQRLAEAAREVELELKGLGAMAGHLPPLEQALADTTEELRRLA